MAFANVGGSLSLKDLVSDGFHPNAEAYKKMGKAWYDALVERDTLIGIQNITGTAFKDRLVGNAEDNILEGGAGNDTLSGGGGVDTFVYRRITDGRDTIADFSVDDRFSISAAGFGGSLVTGTGLSTTDSPTGVFVSGVAPVPIGTSTIFLYNTSTGVLSCDLDGNGSRVALPITTLNKTPTLSAAQFYIK